MLDTLFIFATLIFFAVAILYIYGCNWFVKDQSVAEKVEITGERKTP